MVVIGSDEVGRPVLGILAKLVLKPLLVAHVHFLVFGFQEVDKSLDKLQGAISERHHDQHLSIKSNINSQRSSHFAYIYLKNCMELHMHFVRHPLHMTFIFFQPRIFSYSIPHIPKL